MNSIDDKKETQNMKHEAIKYLFSKYSVFITLGFISYIDLPTLDEFFSHSDFSSFLNDFNQLHEKLFSAENILCNNPLQIVNSSKKEFLAGEEKFSYAKSPSYLFEPQSLDFLKDLFAKVGLPLNQGRIFYHELYDLLADKEKSNILAKTFKHKAFL